MEEKLESELPKKWLKEIESEGHEEAATTLSTHRTAMSTHRTEMSEHRTDLSNARSHMSNERTHLSYLRTSLSLLTFGITLNRFSIYLRENKVHPKVHSMLYETQYVGVGMVLLGLFILSWALYHYRRVSREIETFTYTSPEKSINTFTLLILIIGGFSAVWMIVNEA